MSDTRPPLEYLLMCSKTSLEELELSRLADAANLRKQVSHALEEWVQAESAAQLARWVLEERRKQHGDPKQGSAVPYHAPANSLKGEHGRPDAKPSLSAGRVELEACGETSGAGLAEGNGKSPTHQRRAPAGKQDRKLRALATNATTLRLRGVASRRRPRADKAYGSAQILRIRADLQERDADVSGTSVAVRSEECNREKQCFAEMSEMLVGALAAGIDNSASDYQLRLPRWFPRVSVARHTLMRAHTVYSGTLTSGCFAA